MELNEDEAILIARALTYVNRHLAEEATRIIESSESDYIRNAANEQYQKDSVEFTKLHMRLADAFPVLRQGTVSAG